MTTSARGFDCSAALSRQRPTSGECLGDMMRAMMWMKMIGRQNNSKSKEVAKSTEQQ